MTIDKRTGISIGILAILIGSLVTVAMDYASVKAQVSQNTSDIHDTRQLITNLTDKLNTYNENLIRTNDNLTTLNDKLKEVE